MGAITVQFLATMLVCSPNERMAREAEHLREGNRVLKGRASHGLQKFADAANLGQLR
jgi:hypothetical protein